MVVINLFGGPGIGKSTVAAGVFSLLKMHGVSCELVTEYAKDLVWGEDFDTLSDQMHVTNTQFDRIDKLDGKVDFVITDSPIIQGSMYTEDEGIKNYIKTLHDTFDNHNYLIVRNHNYDPVGRNETLEEASALDKKVDDLLRGKYYTHIHSNHQGVNTIVHDIVNTILGRRVKYELHRELDE